MKALVLLFHLSARNLWRQRRRNSILLVAVIIAVAGVLNMNALMRGMLLGVVDGTVNNFVGHVKLQHPGYGDDPNLTSGFKYDPTVFDSLDPEELEGTAARLVVPAVIRSERETRGVQLHGLNPENENISVFDELQIEGQTIQNTQDRGLVIGAALAEELKTGLNRRLVLMAQDEAGFSQEIGIRVVGIFQMSPRSLEKIYVFTGLDSLQERLETDRVTELSVRFNDIELTEARVEQIRKENPDLSVHTWLTIDPFTTTMYNLVGAAIYIMTIIIMGSLVFGLTNTFVTAVMERIREFGLLRSVGMQAWQVLVQVLIESTILMLIGIGFGLLIGILLYLGYQDGIDLTSFAAGMEYAGMAPKFKPSLHVNDIQVIVFLSLALGVLASLYPARRAMKLSPLEAIKR